MIWVISNLHFDNGLLSRFLRYYRQRGVERFGFITHADFSESPLLNAKDVVVKKIDDIYQGGPVDNQHLLDFKNENLKSDDWYIPADLDEFYWTPGLCHFMHLTGKWEYIPAKFVDRIPADGVIKPLTKEALDYQCPLGAKLINRLCGGCDDKIAMARAHIDTVSGHHFVTYGKKAPFIVQAHHFKFFSDILWKWSNHKRNFYKAEVDFFREHYQIHGRINVLHEGLGIFESPEIGI